MQGGGPDVISSDGLPVPDQLVASIGASVFTPRVLSLIWAEQLLARIGNSNSRLGQELELKHFFLSEPNAVELRLASRRVKLPLRLRERALWGQKLLHYYNYKSYNINKNYAI